MSARSWPRCATRSISTCGALRRSGRCRNGATDGRQAGQDHRVKEVVAMSDELNIGETGARRQACLGQTVWISVYAGETGPLLTGRASLGMSVTISTWSRYRQPRLAANY